jgi:hypothetical protein
MDESIFERLDRMTKERDAAVAEAKELKEALHDAWTDIAQQNHKSRQQIRPEPSRLEIAAQFAASAWQNPKSMGLEDRMKWAFAMADALIAAAKEGK